MQHNSTAAHPVSSKMSVKLIQHLSTTFGTKTKKYNFCEDRALEDFDE